MGQRWTTRTGWQVELADDDGRPTYHLTGPGKLYVGVCYTLDELVEFLGRQGVDLADLIEDEE